MPELKPCPFCGSTTAPTVMNQNEAQWYPTNFIALGMVEPPNDNLGSNEGCMSADIGYNGTEDADRTDISRYKEYSHRNNSMIFLCRDCMREFLKSLRFNAFGQ